MSEEINKLVAVHVMNNKWPVNIAPRTFGPDGTEDGGHDMFGTPAFSTDIAAAWQVVEKMRKGGVWIVNISTKRLPYHDDVYVRFTGPMGSAEIKSHVGMNKSPETAICLAALLALGIHIPTQGATP